MKKDVSENTVYCGRTFRQKARVNGDDWMLFFLLVALLVLLAGFISNLYSASGLLDKQPEAILSFVVSTASEFVLAAIVTHKIFLVIEEVEDSN